MRAKFFFIVIISLSGLACAEASAGSASGHLTIEGLGFLEAQSKDVDRAEGRAQIEYDRTLHFGASGDDDSPWKFRFHPFFMAYSDPGAWAQPVFFDPRDISFSYESKHVFARVGFFTLHWEGTDGINPMDIATLKNYGDPLDPQSQSSLGLHTGGSRKEFEWEAAYVPRQRAPSMPGNESAWWPRRTRFPLRNEQFELRLPGGVDYDIRGHRELNHALSNNYMGRLQLHHDWLELAAAFYEGAAAGSLLDPELTVNPIVVGNTITFQLQNPVRIDPVDYRRRTVSGLATVTKDQWIARASTRYDQPLGDAKRETTWSQQTVAGLERSFSFTEQTLTIILQGSWVHHPQDASLISIDDLFDKAILAGLRDAIGEKWTVLFSGLYSPHTDSAFIDGELTRKINDNWSAKLFLQTVYGPPQSLLGILSREDRVGLQLTRAF